ncbi:hypothetical protein C6I20_13070 [Aeromicrobium sp. A1-2]|uniref:DUF192 domain-containing protein n=1 Tax=Aeromicrobium sp. A1-2 TaxID=2107713 RepID=UPI000E527DE1|nr:DUF192 domain-containing protein [Aeromicrobium sp. A1-2]AXT86024.1 hypothetical protein C6I20_13070 [Aeromicrobium sp. A1-2]
MRVLTVDGRPVGAVEMADSYGTRRKGLLGRDGLDGAIWLMPCRHVHTMGMRFAIDVALVDRDGRVLHVQTMPPRRLGAMRRRSRSVLEAEAGAFRRWGVAPGAVLAAQ